MRSMAWTPVVGSLTAGDSARIATSTSCRKPNAGSCTKVRSPRMREEPGHIGVAEVPAVHQRNRGAVSQVLPYSNGQLEPALLLPAQFGQAVQVGGRHDPGRPGVAQAPR